METQYNEKHQMKSFLQHHKENISTNLMEKQYNEKHQMKSFLQHHKGEYKYHNVPNNQG